MTVVKIVGDQECQQAEMPFWGMVAELMRGGRVSGNRSIGGIAVLDCWNALGVGAVEWFVPACRAVLVC